MIPDHRQFIEAIPDRKKVCVRFYSRADSEVIDLVCAPMDYGPGAGIPDGVNRYSLWDYTSNNGSHVLSFLPRPLMHQTARTRSRTSPVPFTVAARTVGGQARRRGRRPANQ